MNIGKGSDINAAEAIYEGTTKVLEPKGIYLLSAVTAFEQSCNR